MWGGINEDNDIDKLCDLLIEKNINTIQLPVVWMNFVDDNYQIKEETIIKLKSIVDKVISKGLYIIICSYDSYEQEWSSLTYKNLPKLLKIMNVQWTQIGEMFKDYNEKVVFSFLNEPRDYTDNLLDGEAYHVLNDANQAFIDLIRNSGGNNLYRQLIITTGWGNYDEDSYKYSIVPTDEYTSIGIHAYKPFSLIHDIIKDEQGNYLESSWDEREEEYSLALLRMVQTLKTNYLDKGFPVILSEFGSRDKNNTTDRAKWLNYYLSLTNAYNIKCFIWDGALTHFDIDATFCLIDRVNYQWAYPELTDVISNAFVNNTFLDVYEEVCEYRKSINEEIIIPKSLTNMVTKEVLNEDEFKISYDQTLIKNIEGKNYATRLGPITFKVISSNVIYYYQIDIIPEYETRHTDFTLKLANNDNGDLQCYITTKGYSSMRVDYNWFSFDETILKVSKYSTITIIGDGSTGIIAVNKETGKVGIIEVTIKDGKVISFNSVLTDE